MLDIIGDILVRFGIIILIIFIMINITDLSDRMGNIETQLQTLIEMNQ